MKNITIIGSGSFGCALAHSFEKNNNVKIWSFTKEERDSININHECMQIPSIKLNNNTKCYLDYEEALKDSEIVVIVVPSNFVRSTCKDIKKYINNQEILLASKGLENEKLLSDVIKEELGKETNIIMGPSFASELGTDNKTFVELSGNKELIKYLENDNLKITYNDDIIGLQVCSALKNVIALISGIVKGLNYGINVDSYVFTEGIREIKEIGLKLGAKESTFYGLAGIGDLYLTSISEKSRNKRAGILIGQGYDLDYVHKEIKDTIEGLNTLSSVKVIIDKYKLNCTLINNLYDIIYNNKEAKYII